MGLKLKLLAFKGEEKVLQHEQGFAVWLTGMSGAGKTTLGTRLEEEFRNRGLRVERLDGDVMRQVLGKGLGFSREDRITNLERAAFVAGLLVKHGVIVVCSFITPYEVCRRYARETIGRYVEVYIKCSLDVLVQRDTKGLYRKAIAGEIEHFTGISDPYEEPQQFDVCVETDKETIDESVSRILGWLETRGYISERGKYKRVVCQR